MKYARIVKNIVAEVFEPHNGFSIDECFPKSIAEQFVIVGDNVQQNWIKNPNGTFSEPVIETTETA